MTAKNAECMTPYKGWYRLNKFVSKSIGNQMDQLIESYRTYQLVEAIQKPLDLLIFLRSIIIEEYLFITSHIYFR